MDDTAALAVMIDRLMRRIHSDVHPRASAVDAERLGPIGGMVLMAIVEREPVSVQTLVDVTGRDKSQMSRMVQMLERKALIVRHQDPNDQRVSLLRSTEAGRDQVALFHGVLVSVVGRLLEPLDPKERRQLSDSIARILSGAGDT